MKLKEHKIAIILGVVGLLIPFIYLISENFFINILFIIHPVLLIISYYLMPLISLFYIQIQEINIITLLYFCIIFFIYYSAIGHFVDKAIKNKIKRKKILAILITTVIVLNAIGFWFMLLSPFGIKFS